MAMKPLSHPSSPESSLIILEQLAPNAAAASSHADHSLQKGRKLATATIGIRRCSE